MVFAFSSLRLSRVWTVKCGHHPSLILFSAATLDQLIEDVGRYGRFRERGGILLGHRRGRHFEVLEATLPMRWDRGSLLSFRRSARGHQAGSRQEMERSGGTVDWVGEWHSHPEAVPSPSGIDRASWREIARERAAPMVFLIIGYSGLWLGLAMPGDAVPIRYREAERSELGVGSSRAE